MFALVINSLWVHVNIWSRCKKQTFSGQNFFTGSGLKVHMGKVELGLGACKLHLKFEADDKN